MYYRFKINQIIALYRRAWKKIELAWGRQWKLRSYFIAERLCHEADVYLQSRADDMFFVLGTGRSGTQLISGLLSQSNDVSVFHEPDFDADVGNMDELLRNKQLALEYWRDFRGVHIYKRWDLARTKLYGEVNSTIRFQVPVIHMLYPRAKFFLVSRDGREVIRSVMGWNQFYSPSSKGAYAIVPLPDDQYYKHWENMSRFEKLCWGWMSTNELLMDYVTAERRLRLEELVTNFDLCKQHLLDPLGIQLSRDAWREHVAIKSKNSSISYAFPSWEEWDPIYKKAFEEICGETMVRLGYDI